jgi:hypothetical protein
VDNLQLYELTLSELTPAQKEVFPSLVVGAVCEMLSPGDWQIALASATRVVKAIRPEHEATVRDVTKRRTQ